MPKAYQSDYEIGYRYASERVAAGVGACRGSILLSWPGRFYSNKAVQPGCRGAWAATTCRSALHCCLWKQATNPISCGCENENR